MDFDTFIKTNLFNDTYGPLGSVRSEDTRCELFKEWLELNSSIISINDHYSMIVKYDEKIDALRASFNEKIEQNNDTIDSPQQAFLYATYFMLGAYKSVLVNHKSNIIAKMNVDIDKDIKN
jgi:hypothetical protein